MTNITTDQLVQREVYYCVSTLISELAKLPQCQDDLMPVLVQDDYEQAAADAGWSSSPDVISSLPNDEGYWMNPEKWHEAGNPVTYLTAQEVCEGENIDPHTNEAYEHWIVSGWLADKLEAAGEMVLRDFMGLTIWGRSTTGQAISQDYVINEIHAGLVGMEVA